MSRRCDSFRDLLFFLLVVVLFFFFVPWSGRHFAPLSAAIATPHGLVANTQRQLAPCPPAGSVSASLCGYGHGHRADMLISQCSWWRSRAAARLDSIWIGSVWGALVITGSSWRCAAEPKTTLTTGWQCIPTQSFVPLTPQPPATSPRYTSPYLSKCIRSLLLLFLLLFILRLVRVACMRTSIGHAKWKYRD